jgi:Domain of unknown function (DUF1508)
MAANGEIIAASRGYETKESTQWVKMNPALVLVRMGSFAEILHSSGTRQGACVSRML